MNNSFETGEYSIYEEEMGLRGHFFRLEVPLTVKRASSNTFLNLMGLCLIKSSDAWCNKRNS